jgi:DNA-directed RNA polymerase subunit RPC12/RpoP
LRKVFLDGLPRDNRGYVSWRESVGRKINFTYDDTDGEFEIMKYNSNKYHVTVMYQNTNHSIFVGDLSNCKISYIVEKRTREYIYQIGEVLEINNSKLRILEQTRLPTGKYNRMLKAYSYECVTCGDTRIKTEDEIKNNGCGVCSGRIVLKGYNDIWTTNPEFGIKLWNPEDGYKFTCGSNQKTDFRCLECGYKIKNKTIHKIFKQGASCPRCSDGRSYPEKFMFNMLEQLNKVFESQLSFKWSNNKKYDFYEEDLKLVIETHGMQHYEHTGFSRTVAEEQENDRIKKDLALNNEIKHYIIIDCRYSEMDWIKDSIHNSELAQLFDLTNVDWLKCHEYACNSLIKFACDLWKSGMRSTQEISNIIKIDRQNVSKYLQKGAMIGWCDYDVENEKKLKYIKVGNIIAEKRRLSVVQLTKDNMYIDEFKSIKDASEKLGISMTAISNACNGKTKTSGGFKWMRKTDYTKKSKSEKRGYYI